MENILTAMNLALHTRMASVLAFLRMMLKDRPTYPQKFGSKMPNPHGTPANLNRRGRPKGVRSQKSIEIADFARQMVESREYRESLKQRLLAGKAPHMEPLLFHYAYGKPVDRIELIGPMVREVHRLAALYGMTAEEVLAEAEAIAQGRD